MTTFLSESFLKRNTVPPTHKYILCGNLRRISEFLKNTSLNGSFRSWYVFQSTNDAAGNCLQPEVIIKNSRLVDEKVVFEVVFSPQWSCVVSSQNDFMNDVKAATTKAK